jgi:hypothetical protein
MPFVSWSPTRNPTRGAREHILVREHILGREHILKRWAPTRNATRWALSTRMRPDIYRLAIYTHKRTHTNTHTQVSSINGKKMGDWHTSGDAGVSFRAKHLAVTDSSHETGVSILIDGRGAYIYIYIYTKYTQTRIQICSMLYVHMQIYNIVHICNINM